MSLNRRSFLGALAASVASAGAKPVLKPLAPDVFENGILRVRVRKPEGWRYFDQLAWSLIWSDTRFESGEMSEDELKALFGRPLVVMAPGDVDHTDVHPNMSIWPDPHIPLTDTIEQAHADYVSGLEHLFRDFNLLEGPESASIGGTKASRIRLLYIAETHVGVSRWCEVEHYLLKRDSIFVSLNFAHATEGHDLSVLEQLSGIRESIQFWD